MTSNPTHKTPKLFLIIACSISAIYLTITLLSPSVQAQKAGISASKKNYKNHRNKIPMSPEILFPEWVSSEWLLSTEKNYKHPDTLNLNLPQFASIPGSKMDSIINEYITDLDIAMMNAPRSWRRNSTDPLVTYITMLDEYPYGTYIGFRCMNGYHKGPINYHLAGGMEKDGKYFVFTHSIAAFLSPTDTNIDIHIVYTECSYTNKYISDFYFNVYPLFD